MKCSECGRPLECWCLRCHYCTDVTYDSEHAEVLRFLEARIAEDKGRGPDMPRMTTFTVKNCHGFYKVTVPVIDPSPQLNIDTSPFPGSEPIKMPEHTWVPAVPDETPPVGMFTLKLGESEPLWLRADRTYTVTATNRQACIVVDRLGATMYADGFAISRVNSKLEIVRVPVHWNAVCLCYGPESTITEKSLP